MPSGNFTDYARVAYGAAVEERFGCTFDELLAVLSHLSEAANA